jgi:DNA polymerase-3 subunit epsilon
MTREICLDIETTGLDPKDGHKIVEIACVELINKTKTNNFFHTYVNPRREVPYEAERIHGLSTEFLKDKPFFDHIVDKFLEFIGDDLLIIHNAGFDTKFLNFELKNLNRKPLEMFRVCDTLAIARNKFPGSPNSLDALCKRFAIDLTKRQKHGALIDTELLCDVYIELMGGAQTGFSFSDNLTESNNNSQLLTNKLEAININDISIKNKNPKNNFPIRSFHLENHEIEAHKEFILKNFKNNFWY